MEKSELQQQAMLPHVGDVLGESYIMYIYIYINHNHIEPACKFPAMPLLLCFVSAKTL